MIHVWAKLVSAIVSQAYFQPQHLLSLHNKSDFGPLTTVFACSFAFHSVDSVICYLRPSRYFFMSLLFLCLIE